MGYICHISVGNSFSFRVESENEGWWWVDCATQASLRCEIGEG